MPGLGFPRRNEKISDKEVYSNGFCSNHGGDDVSYYQLEKFWSELSPHARQKLLRIDKHAFFEQARKNMCCSRCNGLLLEGFMQIVMYGKSLQQEGGAGGHLNYNKPGAKKDQINCGSWNTSDACGDEIQDPSVHPWGGLTATRDGSLTLLDCYLYAKSLEGLENVFNGARGRERERELLYPDACGGGSRGWISHGMASYGRGHGTRETCALHTARLSCDTLVDFWSALGEETQQSLLRMKEEDFIERLMYRFDSKRFCRDCRRNVIREFKELKELKRMKRGLRCGSWFCVANTAFQYEVSDGTVQADWCETFADTISTYHHFEWAVGTGEGKSDIVGFENVGMNRSVQISGLDLGGLSACFITLRACKMDGRCTELSVRAHALKGQQCVHRRLVVGDSFVAITRGESIRHFFEHAEEVEEEEEEDDDSVDKDGNELDIECSRPQKHAKSPELAREFLLDAATVIFKEQVEKAFREGTARQNAHNIFVCLSLKLLEERIHVACKEIITLEKQMKLLEEEEKEKRKEEERKERKRTKEREKKLRRKEKLKGKDKAKENPTPDIPQDETSENVDEECSHAISSADSISERDAMPESLSIWNDKFLNGHATSVIQKDSINCPDGEVKVMKDGSDSFTSEGLKSPHLKSKFRKDLQLKSSVKWTQRGQFAVITESGVVTNRSELRRYGDGFETSRGSHVSNVQSRWNGRFKFNDKFYCTDNKMNEFHSCSFHQNSEYRVKVTSHVSAARVNRESKSVASLDLSKQLYRGNRCSQMEYKREGCGRTKSKSGSLNYSFGGDVLNSKKVWEPMESQRRYRCSNSDTNVMVEVSLNDYGKDHDINSNSYGDSSCAKANILGEVGHEESSVVTDENCHSAGPMEAKEPYFSSEVVYDDVNSPAETCMSSGTSDRSLHSTVNPGNCLSRLSEGDCSPSSSNLGALESSSISDSGESSQQFEGRENLGCTQNGIPNDHEVGTQKTAFTNGEEADGKRSHIPADVLRVKLENSPIKATCSAGSAFNFVNVDAEQVMFPPSQPLQLNMFSSPSTMGYYFQNPFSWSTAPANGYLPFSQGNQYLYADPFAYSPQFCLQYGPMQHLAASFLSTPVPVYQPGPKLSTEGQSILQEAVTEANPNLMTPAGRFPAEALLDGRVKTDNSTKLQANSSNFSLFHFGGPVELSKDEISGVFSSKVTKDQIENNPSFNKGTTAEEYNLFAASNGIRFSIF